MAKKALGPVSSSPSVKKKYYYGCAKREGRWLFPFFYVLVDAYVCWSMI